MSNKPTYLHMDPDDSHMFRKYLAQARSYFEYGSGGSTLAAATQPNIKYIWSVENDRIWYNKLSAEISQLDITTDKKTNIKLIYHDMPIMANNWGRPSNTVTDEQQSSYSTYLSNLSSEELQQLDLVLIDGRYRVACALKAFDAISPQCLIAFDDFFPRKYYHIVLDFYDIVEQTKDNKQAILKKKPDASSPSPQLIAKYEHDSK